MSARLMLLAVPLVTLGAGLLTFRGSPAAVPLQRVTLTSAENILAQQAGDDEARPTHFPYRYDGFRFGYRYAGFPYQDPRYNAYRYPGYSYVSYPYRDPGFGYRYSGYRHNGYRYSGFRYRDFLYGNFRYVGYRYSVYRYSGYRYSFSRSLSNHSSPLAPRAEDRSRSERTTISNGGGEQ